MNPLGRVGIVGGGIAGIAAAVALASRGVQVELFEGQSALGGSAGGGVLGPCLFSTGNLTSLCAQIGASKAFQRRTRLHWFAPDGRRSDIYPLPGFPAPLHLVPCLLRSTFLTWKERWSVMKACRELAAPLSDEDAELSVLRWLRLHDQSHNAIDRFWSVLLVRPLGVPLEQASLPLARQFLLDGLLRNRAGFGIEIATSPLQQSLFAPAKTWLESRGAKLHLDAPVRLILGSPAQCQGFLMENGQTHSFDAVIVATPWNKLSHLLADSLHPAIPELLRLTSIVPTSQTSVQLWFDRPLTPLSHALVSEGMVEWILRMHARAAADRHDSSGFQYQALLRLTAPIGDFSEAVLFEKIRGELAKIFPASRDARLLRTKIAAEPNTLYPGTSEAEALRPSQETSAPNLFLAGAWTKTGQPSTLESAAASGHLAAEALLRYLGQPASITQPKPPVEWLARRVLFS